MRYIISKKDRTLFGKISITGSKSESNRLLILNSLFDEALDLSNISNSEDTLLMRKALASKADLIDIHHAGTAMRFLTAYFSIQEGREVVLTGSSRMKERPISILVNALRTLGADISYLEKEGFPPLSIKGRKLSKNKVGLSSEISSQYISALMLMGAKLENGLMITLRGKIISLPYLMMTVEMLQTVGITAKIDQNTITIPAVSEIEKKQIAIESDWSSASYYYSLVALAEQAEITLDTYYENSLQGDAALVSIYKTYFGVETLFDKEKLILTKNPNFVLNKNILLNLNETPDIAQTIAVTCAGLKIKCKLKGLETLKIKETDRLVAMQNELAKFGVEVELTNDSLEIINFLDSEQLQPIRTYNDHRMAMSFSPLALIQPIDIENPEVVEKSYPTFWDDLKQIGLVLSEKDSF